MHFLPSVFLPPRYSTRNFSCHFATLFFSILALGSDIRLFYISHLKKKQKNIVKQNSKPIFGIFGFFSSGPWIIRYSAKKKNIRIRYSEFKILIFGFGFEVPNTRYSGRILGFESISLTGKRGVFEPSGT